MLNIRTTEYGDNFAWFLPILGLGRKKIREKILLIGSYFIFTGWVWGQVIFSLFPRLVDNYAEPLLIVPILVIIWNKDI